MLRLKAALLVVLFGLAGCMGQMGMSQTVMAYNMKVVDNRYGRAVTYMIASPIYAVVGAIDFVIINSIEFWTGKNPYTNKPALVDQKVDTWFKVNEHLGDEMKSAPIKSGRLHHLEEGTVALDMEHSDGTRSQLTSKKVDDRVDFYLDGKLVASMTIDQISARAADNQGKLASLRLPANSVALESIGTPAIAEENKVAVLLR